MCHFMTIASFFFFIIKMRVPSWCWKKIVDYTRRRKKRKIIHYLMQNNVVEKQGVCPWCSKLGSNPIQSYRIDMSCQATCIIWMDVGMELRICSVSYIFINDIKHDDDIGRQERERERQRQQRQDEQLSSSSSPSMQQQRQPRQQPSDGGILYTDDYVVSSAMIIVIISSIRINIHINVVEW